MKNKQAIAIYGLSTETEKVLPEFVENYIVVGLLDGFRTEGELYGQQIISIENAIARGIKKIVVVARPGSCKAISKRIGKICRDNDIELQDVQGRDLLESNKVVYEFGLLHGPVKSEIINAITENDVISFDLFDTLIMRNIFSPLDVLELVEDSLRENDIVVENFVARRVAAEKRLSQNAAPQLIQIYTYAFPEMNEIQLQKMVLTEYEIDCKLIIPRSEVCEVLVYAYNCGKKVIITTDSYYNKKQIESILRFNSITNYDDVFVSCEYGYGKTCGLFDIVKENVQGNRILHIGDDDLADVRSAENAGINSYKLLSGLEMFDALGGLGLEDKVYSLSDKIKIGMFIAEIFNSPFQFEDDERRVYIDSAEGIGSLICAPIIIDFVEWFVEQTEQNQYSNIWFGARDGYLIKQLYEMIMSGRKAEYVLTSRTAAVRAGISDISDIEYVDSMKYSGTLEENLKRRFDINLEEIDKNEINNDEEGLSKFSKTIFNRAKSACRYYQRYIGRILTNDDDIAFFDFVAKGTTQLFLQKIVKNHLRGYYFLQLEPECMKDKCIDIVPFYTEEERAKSAIFDLYYILETILTAPEPSLDGFDENGHPIYTGETRTVDNIEYVMKIHSGIKDYVQKYIALCPKYERKINKQLDEAILQLISKVEIRDTGFMSLVVEDPFFNRMTDIADII